MKNRILLLPVLALLLAQSVPAQSLLLGRNIFPEGSFDILGDSDRVPSGWSFPDPNDKPWKAGFHAEAVKGESGSKELRLTNPAFGYSGAQAKLSLPPKIESLRITFRLQAKNVTIGEPDSAGNGAGVYARFYDAAAKAIPGSAGWVGGLTQSSDTEWQDKEKILHVPATATTLEIQVMLRSASGEIRVDDVEVVPVAMRK